DLRPQLVQPRRGGARDGILQRGGGEVVPHRHAAGRAADGQVGDHPAQVLAGGVAGRADETARGAHRRRPQALEALADGPQVVHPMGRLYSRPGRHVRGHRHRLGALVCRALGRQAPGAAEHHLAPSRTDPVQVAASRESEAAEAEARQARARLSVQDRARRGLIRGRREGADRAGAKEATSMSEKPPRTARRRLTSIAPGLATLLSYHRGDLRYDVTAGLSVAAVAIPVGVAYAQLAGFQPVVGLYASILPLVAYALFGTSRQLIVGPDAATCAMVAAAVAPLAGGDARLYLSLTVVLTFLAGLLCIGASFLRLGALADFLSRPILVGYLAGIALMIVLGQIGKVTGLTIEAGGIAPRLLELVQKLPLIHWPTLAVPPRPL